MSQVTWVKCTENGFEIGKPGRITPELQGTIKETDWFHVKWNKNKTVDEKVVAQKGIPKPEGYKTTVRVEVKTIAGNECKIEFTAAQTSQYLKYKTQLKKVGKDVSTVITRMKPFQSGGNGKTYPNIDFQEV